MHHRRTSDSSGAPVPARRKLTAPPSSDGCDKLSQAPDLAWSGLIVGKKDASTNTRPTPDRPQLSIGQQLWRARMVGIVHNGMNLCPPFYFFPPCQTGSEHLARPGRRMILQIKPGPSAITRRSHLREKRLRARTVMTPVYCGRIFLPQYIMYYIATSALAETSVAENSLMKPGRRPCKRSKARRAQNRDYPTR